MEGRGGRCERSAVRGTVSGSWGAAEGRLSDLPKDKHAASLSALCVPDSTLGLGLSLRLTD